VAADSQNSDDSGKVYDFKDSKTSGVVTVTKNWDDSSSNDERTIPDVSISTVEPSKLNQTYTITFHGNGLKFADGSEENTVVYNGSGQVITGQYKCPIGNMISWYFDESCKKQTSINENGTLTKDFIEHAESQTVDLYAKEKTYIIKSGYDFRVLVPDTVTKVIFTDELMPSSVNMIDFDADSDNGIVGWLKDNTLYISSQKKGQKIIAKDCSGWFYYKNSLVSIDFSNLDTDNVTNMYSMFAGCSSLTSLNLTGFNTGKVTNMGYMFSSCRALEKIEGLASFDVGNVQSMNGMFMSCNSLKEINVGHWRTDELKAMQSIFSSCTSVEELDLSNFNTSAVDDMSTIFDYCKNLKHVNLSNLDTSSVKTMRNMFNECNSLVSLDLSGFDTSSVTAMDTMFFNCNSLNTLDLSSWDVSKVTNLYMMFRNCTSLVSLDLSSWDTNGSPNMSYMFQKCDALTSINLGSRFAFIDSDYYLPKGTWYSSDGTAYTSNGKSCTIPNNKADTYTRK